MNWVSFYCDCIRIAPENRKHSSTSLRAIHRLAARYHDTIEMSPLPAPTRIQVRADEIVAMTSSSNFGTPASTPTTSDPGTSTSTPTTSDLSTPTQESPCRPNLITDTSTPPLPSTYTTETLSPSRPQPSIQSGMSFGTKLGLGMIPVILLLCCLWLSFLFWWRRRKAQKGVALPPPPPVPEKDGLFLVPSLGSSRRGSKVFNMAAFSTPVQCGDGRWREAQVYRQREAAQEEEERRRGEQSQRSEHDSFSDIIRFANSDLSHPGSSRPGPDSPIDRTSPFRLKRGDTVRRSLGSEISSLWPSPPPSVWVKRPNNERSCSAKSNKPVSLRRPHFCGEEYETRTYASSERHA
jgi:hypothetical protein